MQSLPTVSATWRSECSPRSFVTAVVASPAIHGHMEADNALFDIVCSAASEKMPQAFDDLALTRACEIWMNAVFACNSYIDEQAPWALKKTDAERMETVLATLYICIAVLGVAIRPVIPGSADKLLDAMGVEPQLRNSKGILGHWYSPLAERFPARCSPAIVSAP